MKTIRYSSIISATLFFGVQLFSSPSIAQYPGGGGQPPQTVYKIDWNERLAPNLGLKPHDHNLLGDNIDLMTGRLSFEHIDISIPGNSDLPVELRRRLNPSQAYNNEFANWQLAVPSISTKIMSTEFNSGIRWGKLRCSNLLYTSIPNSTYMQRRVTGASAIYPSYYSDGVLLDVPGRASGQLLDKTVAGSWPAEAKKVTASGWYFTCLTNIDGAGTEGFYGYAPNGDRYTFNVVRSRNAIAKNEMWHITYTNSGPLTNYGEDWAYYDVLAASEVTDKNGNWVKYSYDTSGRLTRIYSNDGRQIDLSYTGGPYQYTNSWGQVQQAFEPYKVVTAITNSGTANQRQWSYVYGGASTNRFIPPAVSNGLPSTGTTYHNQLKTVTLPDGRSWQFNLGGLFAEAVPGVGYSTFPGNQSATCKQLNQTVSVTHPDGITGQFELQEFSRLLVLVNVQQYGPPCPNSTWGQGYNLNTYSDVMAVVKKTLSASSVPTAIWEYSYTNPNNGIAYNRTTVKQPDGSKLYNSYNMPIHHSSLMKSEIYPSMESTTPLQITEYAYIHEPAAGSGYVASDTSDVRYPLRTSSVTITQGSDWYKTQNTYITDRNAANYSYGNPVTVDEWSSLGNGTRTTNVTYLKDSDDWILGLPDTITKNGKLFDDYDWDDKGRLVTHKQFGTTAGTGVTVATLAYHTNNPQSGQLYSYYDAIGRLTTFNNYYRGTPQLITRADNSQVSYQIDENGWVKGITNARGYTTNYQYNPIGRLTLIDLPSPWNDTSVSYTYSGGNLLQTVTKGMERTTNTFDAMLRPTKVLREDLAGSLGSIQSIKNYDAMGRETFASLPGIGAPSVYGKTTSYDAFGRVLTTTETAPGGGTTNYTYLAGNKTRVTDPLGNSVTTTASGYANPGDGKTLKVEKPAGITTDLSYDIYGNLLTITQAKGDGTSHLSSYIYDDRLRVCRTKIPEKGDALFQYNDANEKIAYAEGLASDSSCPLPSGSSRVEQTYDGLSRPLATNFADSTPDINRSYDANGNITSVNRNGVNWSYTYNSIDLVQTETLSLDSRTYSTSNSYDNDGVLISKTYPSGQRYDYTNDWFGLPTTITGNSTDYIYSVSYHANGKINRLSRGNGGTYEQRLNDRQLTSFIGGNWGDSQYYYYNANAQVTQVDAVNYNVYDRVFGYDAVGRLTSASGPWGTGEYIYDTLNNIIHKREGSRVAEVSYNSLNQVSHARDLNISPYWRAYTHDTRGNVINDGRFSFNYDLSNQPVSMSGSVNSSFTYDGNLRRVKQIVNGETIYSIYDKSGAVLTQDNVTTNTKTDYLSVAGQTFTRIKNGVAYYPLNDHLGTAYMEADQNGSVASNKTYNYTPFGETTNYVPFGSAGNDPGNNTEQGFTGHIEDKSGLTYMQARYYDPVIGRFLSTDPIGYEDGLNVYAYVGNDPVNKFDPNGTMANVVRAAVTVCMAVPSCRKQAVDAVEQGVESLVESAIGGLDDIAEGTVNNGNDKSSGEKRAGRSKVHGNSKASTKSQHRYEISNESTGDVVKTGISGKELNKNGSSPRANSQVNAINKTAAEGDKVKATVKETGIPGRAVGLNNEQTATDKLHADGHSLERQCRPKPSQSGGC